MTVLRWLWLRWKALRAFSFPCSAMPVLLAGAASGPLAAWRLDILAACLIGVVSLHAAGNLLNDYFDVLTGVDSLADDDPARPGRLMLRGELTPRNYRNEAVFFLGLAAPMALYVVLEAGPAVLAFSAVGLFALYAYTGPPFRLKTRALGELVMFVVFGPAIVLGVGYAMTGTLRPILWLVSVPPGLLTSAVLVSNNIRDAAEDRDAGIRTIAQTAGVPFARWLYTTLAVVSAVWPAALAVVGVGPTGFLLTPAALIVAAGPLRAIHTGRRLPNIDARTAAYLFAVQAVMVVALLPSTINDQ